MLYLIEIHQVVSSIEHEVRSLPRPYVNFMKFIARETESVSLFNI